MWGLVLKIRNVLPLGEMAGFEALTFNLALSPPFCQTAVTRSHIYFFLFFFGFSGMGIGSM
ncbi:hypothetical protein FPG48_03530 [Flavobacterium psychrophilum]|nr:hypothetical protein FPG48_03530 [Flavobacterium psychrophilum]